MRRVLFCASLIFLLSTSGLFSQETNKFRIRIRSALTGTEEYEITRTTDGYHLTGKSHLEREGWSMDATHEQTLAPDLTLIRYKMLAGGNQVIEAWREAENIQMRVSAGGQQAAKSVPFTSSMIVLDNMVTAHFQVLLNSLAGKPSTTNTWTFTFLVPQAQAAISGKISRGGEEPASLNGKPVRAQKYTVEFANLIEEFWAGATTNELMRVYVPVQYVELVREGFSMAPKAEPKDSIPATFVERQNHQSHGPPPATEGRLRILDLPPGGHRGPDRVLV